MTMRGGWRFGIHGFIKRRIDACYFAVIDLMEEGAAYARHLTETRPSARSGKQGRVDTGRMEDEIVDETIRRGNEIVGRFGFLNFAEFYFVLQTETGFRHFGSGEFIEPTFALRDTEDYIRQQMTLRLRRIWEAQ